MKPDQNIESRMIPASAVCDLCGGVSDMTVWRWLHRSDLNFPRTVYICRRRIWRESEIHAWLKSRPREVAGERSLMHFGKPRK